MSAASSTPSQTVGPFFSLGLTWEGASSLVDSDDPGAILIEGLVRDGGGDPVPDAMLEIWQADDEGRFPPDGRPGWAGFGRSLTDPEGAFHFLTLKPGPVPAPDGSLAAPHIEVQIFGRGLLRQLRTRIYFADEAAANEQDQVLASIPEQGARRTLIAEPTTSGYHFDVILQGAGETVFFGR